ncbi:hypothetical protein P5673_033092 [Acropora cervicornis]|uniref:Uncharacterized protein n=1 Tax=Acropora cervicornis TaxID=6130 RepID=A0AAD9URL0_ACRCE|nr:hypothetical protein P5673_033092 [Acropora cervicornis]
MGTILPVATAVATLKILHPTNTRSSPQKLEAVPGKDHRKMSLDAPATKRSILPMATQLSPGSTSLKFAKKMDKRILSLKEKQKTREYKKRRIEKKENRLKKTKQLQN